jgi:hypothetical protein
MLTLCKNDTFAGTELRVISVIFLITRTVKTILLTTFTRAKTKKNSLQDVVYMEFKDHAQFTERGFPSGPS